VIQFAAMLLPRLGEVFIAGDYLSASILATLFFGYDFSVFFY
jgi:hypothetical protein